ncbi:MAG TPA: thiamine pyrophosphate-dependent enzyme [Fimbriimonadaceae bacterium]|nr:thiamine pyrophosphate-dependent enzyme [Fimbriimonadaceae bacterium]
MSAAPVIASNTKLDFLRLMMLSREGDRREGILLRQSKGWFQVSGMGHEALAALQLSLRPDDWLFPYYRSRALMLARGLSNYDLALAYFAKRDSSSGGRQMPGHYSSHGHNVFSVCTPTGGSLIPACGTAWAMKLSGKDSVCVASVGDAASRQGEFYEAIAFAIQEKLPVIFVIEDNKYGISTPTEHFMAYNIGGILSEEHMVKVNARTVDAVHEAMQAATAKARRGEGPTILWCDLDRLSSHTSSDDHRVYRAAEDIEAMQSRDPILLLKNELIAAGELTEEQFEEIQADVTRVVDEDYLKAEKAEDPRADEVMLHGWGEEPAPVRPPIEPGPMTMVDAINKTFLKALENDPNVIFFGEDIEDPKGGVFKITAGCSENFPKQVFNSPLAEATIMGVAVGMAAYGMRPVFELQFVDFISPGWNQIATNMSTLRWRSFGHWKCPMVIYAPYGAYLPGGSLWHSQAYEAGIAHLPGLKIAIPSTPEDAAGLFWTAIHGDDPAFILVPKHIFRKRVDVKSVEPIPFGRARIVREGADVTVVTYGNTLELAEEAATRLESECSVEIIDLRSIVPCDYETITRSVEKTGRLVVIQEDNRTCGFGQAVIAEMTSKPERFNLFLASPQLVSRDDVHIGYNPIYEYAALPDLEEVVGAIRTTME